MKRFFKRQSPPFAVTIKLVCRSGAICLFLMILLSLKPVCSEAEQDEDNPKLFRSGFLQSVFSNIDPRDAKAVMEVHGKKIVGELKMNIIDKVVMFTSLKSMMDAVRKGELELVSIPSIEYLRVRETVPLIPAFVGTNNHGQGNNFLLITRKDSGIKSFSDLTGKSLLLPPVAIYEPSHLWLEVLLLKEGNMRRDTYFREVKESPKISKAIMAIFFKQADAAIVTRSGLEISQQLNPQVGTQLNVLAESPNLSDFVVCMNPHTSEGFRKKLSGALTRLNDSKSGKQLYVIFQTNGITPFESVYLDGLENLQREHKRLRSKTVARK